jgi:biopolymer transport protein ExbB
MIVLLVLPSLGQEGLPLGAAPVEPSIAAPPADGAVNTIANKSIGSFFLDGGPLMWPILGSSILLVVFVLERLIMLRKARVVAPLFVNRFLEQIKERNLGRDAALELCEENGSPVARVFLGALKKWGRPAVEVEQAVIDAGERVTHELRKYLRLFNGIASISPLLGLLGTVLGMISSFNAIVSSKAMDRSELLAGGIGEALLTTAGGLFVAIPALMAYMFFQSRAEALIMDIDAAAQQLVEMVSAEALEREASAKPTSRKTKAA